MLILNKSFNISIVICSLLVLAFTGCDYRFKVNPDKNDYVIYQSGGGELGSSWVKIMFHGDGSVEYYVTYPYEGTLPQKEISGTYKLSIGRTEKLFQSLIDAGLFTLKDKTMQGADLPFTGISANIDGHTLDVSWNIITDSESDKKYAKMNMLIWKISREMAIPEPIMHNDEL